MGSSRKAWLSRLSISLKRTPRWLVPGINVKRWIVLFLFGTTLVALGFAVIVIDFYRTAPDTWWLPYLSTASLRFLPRPLRALIFGGLGLSLIAIGMWGMNKSILAPFIRPGRPIVDALTKYHRKERGPRIVVIGGGHGLATLLRGLKSYSHKITAVVTVSDDGGSSGLLRESLGILPPGDLRNCLAALSNDEDLLTQLFQFRFADEGNVPGHSFGNLFISALTEITGSFEDAVSESGRVLSVHGRVLPSTLKDMRLAAEVKLANSPDSIQVFGESDIAKYSGMIQRIWLEPDNPRAFPGVIQAIFSADLIIVGPGSLYTSILPNLLVPEISAAIQACKALKFFILNIVTQPGETTGFNCSDHLQAIEKHVGTNLFDLVVNNTNYSGDLPENIHFVHCDPDTEPNYMFYGADLLDDQDPIHHDSTKLARVTIDLYRQKTGPLADQ